MSSLLRDLTGVPGRGLGLSVTASSYLLGFESRPDPAEHELVDLVRAHAYKRDGIDLLVDQAASSKRASLVRCKSLDLVGRLRLIWIDWSESPEPPSACDGKGEAVIAEALGLQACP